MATKIESNQDLMIYRDQQHYRIFAGPGAGKTHLLIENIKAIVEHSRQIKSGIKKVLCITYTNAAADEITQRLGSYSKYVVVSTIHSFINEYIFNQFQVQLKSQIKADFGISISKETYVQSQQEGFTTLSGKSKEEIFEFIKANYPQILQSEYCELSKKRMIGIEIDITPVNQVSSTGKEKVSLKLEKLSPELAQAIKDFTWSVAGKLAFDEILYFGWKLVSKYELIAHMLRVEFPYILIDEYQDTNPIQNLIVRKLSEKGVVIVVVGDIAQSIYSFQGASYLDFKNFRLPSTLPIRDFVIEGNRRSTENIIKLLNYLRQKDRTLVTQYCAKNQDTNDLITFIIQKDKKKPTRSIWDIIGENTKVLCRKWDEAFGYVSNISESQKKLLGSISGAYTYQLSRDMFTEVEARQENWIDLAYTFLNCEKAYKIRSLPMFLDTIGRFVNVKELFSAFNPDKGRQLNLLVQFWEDMFASIDDTALLKDVCNQANNKLKAMGLEVIEEFKYPNVGEEDYFEPVYKYVDQITFQTAKIMVGEIFIDDSKYMTIHRAKGKEFKSVLVNGEPFKKEKDFAQVPRVLNNPVIISGTNDDTELMLEEYTRLLYVGYSRAIDKLYIHMFGDEKLEESIRTALTAYYPDSPPFYEFEYC
ncbi:MAG: ATP-dependent helicase [Enterocloster citroniae]|nr:ATP-dependent helicase [Enterocloster citroniae]